MSMTNLSVTACKSRHLTSFGSFYVAPNPIPIPTFALLKDGYVLLVVVCILNMLFIVSLMMLRRLDRSDILKVQSTSGNISIHIMNNNQSICSRIFKILYP